MQEIVKLNKKNISKIIKDNLLDLTSNYLEIIKNSLENFETKITESNVLTNF